MEVQQFKFQIKRPIDEVDEALFWRVIEIWWTKPHCVNKRVCGADFPSSDGGGIGDLTNAEMRFLDAVGCKNGKAETRRLLPKNGNFGWMKEILCKDEHSCKAVFLPQIPSDGMDHNDQLRLPHVCLRYAVSLASEMDNASLVLQVEKSDGDSSAKWLIDNFMPTLIRWMNNCSVDKPLTQSLRLIDLEAYNACYNRLKTVYGRRLVQIWPERTDPKKFVYEDVATAAYLLTLWEQDRRAGRCSRMQTFVDLGCGNGLLVYLLTAENHLGYGIDLRRRKIWNLYGPDVRLIEKAFDPSDQHLFPDADWIIGNHSDELTPWIPVIAAKSSPTCNFFVIPCCAWDFRGKYQRKDADVSTYRSYLRYVKHVGERCGFDSEDDILKIPSTKRACIVGRRNPTADRDTVLSSIHKLLGDTNSSEMKSNKDQMWMDGFAQREAKEPIRNCTALPKISIDSILKKITAKLLEENRYVETADGRRWKIGGSLTIPQCAELMDQEDLRVMKAQCGGLQTLMRNHHQIFNVCKGSVSIRDWIQDANRYRKNDKRPCWFFANHADGCPLLDAECPYAHV